MNQTVERNLKLISEYYSSGQTSLLREVAKMTPENKPVENEDDVVLPYKEGKQPRLVIFGGLPSLKWFSNYCKSQYVRETVLGIIVIENNKQQVCNLLNDPQFSKFITSPIIRFILCPGKENIKSMFYNVLKETEFSTIMDSAMFFPYNTATAEDMDVYEFVGHSYEETVFHVYHNYGRIDDSIEGIRSTLFNKDRLMSEPGIWDLKDKAKGLTAVIVGAGPSLDHNIKLLAENKDKFIIIAVDAAVKPLLKHGIEPHFTTSIERGNIYQKPFWEGLPSINTQLVYFPVVHPDVLALYPGPKRPVYRNYSYFAYFEFSWPKKIMHSGGSTSHLANRLAVFLGVKEIIYVGLDNCYEKHDEENTYRSHCNGLGYEDWATYHPIEYFNKEKNHAPAYKVIAFDNTATVTNVTYHQWAKEFEEEILVLNLRGRVFHTNPKAAAITGVIYRPLEQICSSLEVIKEMPNFKPNNLVNRYRTWDHSYLIKSFKGWINKLDVVLNYIDIDIKNLEEKIQLKVIATMYDFLDRKFTKDSLFISFIIQNCAAEYYRSCNEWNALPNQLNKEIEERLKIIKDRVSLYKEVLTKLIKLFEEEIK